MSLGETISPSKGPRNQNLIGLGADGDPVGNGLPDFRIGGRGDAARGEGWDKGGIGEEEPPPSSRTIGGSKTPRSTRMGSGREGLGFGKFGSPDPNSEAAHRW